MMNTLQFTRFQIISLFVCFFVQLFVFHALDKIYNIIIIK